MKAFVTFLVVILLTIANTFFNGWLWYNAYGLGVAPLINHLNIAPYIPYTYFLLLSLAWSVIKSKNVNDNTKITEVKFWTKYFGVICTDLLILGILYIFNICIL